MTQPSPPGSGKQTWSVIAHASALIQFVGIPSVAGPLVVWLIRRDDPAVEPHARAALNFQLSLLIYFLVGGLIAFVALVTIIGILLSVLIVFALVLLVVLEVLFAILGAIAAGRGELYDYPLSLELIKG